MIDALTVEDRVLLGLPNVEWCDGAVVSKLGLSVGVALHVGVNFVWLDCDSLCPLNKVFPMLDVLLKHVKQLDVNILGRNLASVKLENFTGFPFLGQLGLESL